MICHSCTIDNKNVREKGAKLITYSVMLRRSMGNSKQTRDWILRHECVIGFVAQISKYASSNEVHL